MPLVLSPLSDLEVTVMTDGKPLQLKVTSKALPFLAAAVTGDRIKKAEIAVFIHLAFTAALVKVALKETGEPSQGKIYIYIFHFTAIVT